jgi:selenocysteine-specific translation elongation factor
MTFIDLAGHEKYLSTTIAGLTGCHPDYAIVIINSLAGVTKMTREHLGVVLALEIPLICVVSKVDMAPLPVLEQSKKQLFRILKSSAAAKMPIQMRSVADVETVVANSANSTKLCPVFFVSSVEGTHIDLLLNYLARLRPHHEWLRHYAAHMEKPSAGLTASAAPSASVALSAGSASGSGGANPTAAEFSIDEVFNVSGIGIVVSGTLNSGTLVPGMTLLLGPQSDNTFTAVLVRSLHYKRVNCSVVEAGQSCAVSIRALKKKDTLKRNLIRRGQVLVDPIVNPKATRYFDAEVLILHHPTTIKLGYQAVLHCGMIRQTARICRLLQKEKECLRTGDKSLCRFRFLLRDEFLHTGAAFVFREGSTKGIGKVVRINFSEAEIAEMEEEDKSRRKSGGKSQMPSTKTAVAAGEGEGAADGHAASAGGAAASSSAPPSSSSSSASHGGKSSHAAGGKAGAGAADSKAADKASASGGAGAGGGGEKGKRWTQAEKDAFKKGEGGGGKK